ncbi:MAG: hypothetical protein JRM99_04890 [Nitrososphaerota archaeon]|nr:hypothetical protein [Nitrososphaerota archaeon]
MGLAAPARLGRWKARLVWHYKMASERDKRWIMQLDLETLQEFVWPLFIGFVCLTFLDVYTTTLAFDFGPLFHEENPIAAALFNLQFQGYLLALAFKYLPMLPLFYLVFIQDKTGKHEMQVKTLKLAGLVTLAGADLFLFYVVGINNLHALLFAP